MTTIQFSVQFSLDGESWQPCKPYLYTSQIKAREDLDLIRESNRLDDLHYHYRIVRTETQTDIIWQEQP